MLSDRAVCSAAAGQIPHSVLLCRFMDAGLDTDSRWVRCAGRTFSASELQIVAEVVGAGGSLSRTQLMVRVCQRLRWRRPSGALKVRECRDLLLSMEHDGWVSLPPKRSGGRPLGSCTQVPCTALGEPGQALRGTVGQFGTVRPATGLHPAPSMTGSVSW